jgi:hypothetical protein
LSLFINSHEHEDPPGSLHLSNIHVEEADGIVLEALSLRLVAFEIWQTGDAVPLEATMRR